MAPFREPQCFSEIAHKFLLHRPCKDICGFVTLKRNAVPANSNVIYAEGMLTMQQRFFGHELSSAAPWRVRRVISLFADHGCTM